MTRSTRVVYTLTACPCVHRRAVAVARWYHGCSRAGLVPRPAHPDTQHQPVLLVASHSARSVCRRGAHRPRSAPASARAGRGPCRVRASHGARRPYPASDLAAHQPRYAPASIPRLSQGRASVTSHAHPDSDRAACAVQYRMRNLEQGSR